MQLGIVAAVIALSPILVVAALRLPLINQLDYADAWFYSAYAWAPKHNFEIFGWNYFAARFPAVLAIGLFKRVFGVRAGYLLLRYALAVACGSSLYACVRRFASVSVAASAVALLYLQPFFSRMLLWDYSGFAEVAAGVIGVSLWYWSDGRRLAWTALAGVALAVAAFSNALIGTALFVFVVVEGLAALRQGRKALLHFGARLLVTVAAGVGVLLVGYLGYTTILGSFDPYELLRPTLEFLSENSKNSAPYQAPVHVWLLHEPRLWMPVITSTALVAVLRGRCLGDDVVARIAQLCIGYTAFLWIYRFTVTSSLVETWWAYSVVVVATAPALGLLLNELEGESRNARRTPMVVAAFALVAFLIRNVSSPVSTMYRAFAEHELLLLALLLAGVVAAVLAGVRGATRLPAFLAFAAILAIMSYAPSILDGRGTTGVFVANASRDWKAYPAGERLLDILQDYDSPSKRVFLWYPGTLGYVSIAWADLPQDADTLNEAGVDETLHQLTPLARARLLLPQVSYVMIFAPHPAEVAVGLRTLVKADVTGRVIRRGDLAQGELGYALLALVKK